MAYEESYQAAYGPGAVRDDPWLMIVFCRHGDIFPHGGSTLAATTEGSGTARKLATLDCTTVWQDGSDGVTMLFDLADFAKVAKVMKSRRRRQMTEKQKRLAAERLAKYAFPPARQSDLEARISTQTAEVVF